MAWGSGMGISCFREVVKCAVLWGVGDILGDGKMCEGGAG